MKTTVLALTTALLIAGSAATTASAQSRYGYDRYERYSSTLNDRDCDGVNDRFDRYARDINDDDCDGVPNRYDRRYNPGYSRIESRMHDNRYGGRYRWNVGTRLPRDYYGASYYVDYEPYGLRRPPYGYRWNRVGDDVYLIATNNGLVIEVQYDIFR